MNLRVIRASLGFRPPLPHLHCEPSMSVPSPTARELVDRLDARHEELIEKLDALNARIELTLAEYTRARDSREYQHDARKVA
jgi:hypothetical protein